MAGFEVEEILDEVLAQNVLLQRNLAEAVSITGIEVQRDVRGELVGENVDAALAKGRARVPTVAGEIEQACLELLVRRML